MQQFFSMFPLKDLNSNHNKKHTDNLVIGKAAIINYYKLLEYYHDAAILKSGISHELEIGILVPPRINNIHSQSKYIYVEVRCSFMIWF